MKSSGETGSRAQAGAGAAKPKAKPATTGAAPAPGLASCAALSGNFFGSLNVARSAIPASWMERAKKALEYYQEEPLVSNAVNAWRTFALGDEVVVLCDDEAVQGEAQAAAVRLGLTPWLKDMVLQLLVKGDCVGYFVRSDKGDDVAQVHCLNPLSVDLKYEDGSLAEATQKPLTGSDSGAQFNAQKLALEQMVHLKWNAPSFDARGNSMVLPAFEAIELLRDYRRAERAIAKRWATPLRFIQVGGAYGNRIVEPSQPLINKIRDEIDSMDMNSGLVVPFYVKAETYGAEGISLDTEAKVAGCKEDILVALGMARSVITGDGPNFATASVSMQKMVVMLKEIKQVARTLLDWVFDEWKARKGYGDATLHYQFSDLDLSNEVDQKRLLLDLYDRGLISKDTLQQKMGLSPEVEAKGSAGEAIILDRNWTAQELSSLVALEVVTADEARKMLGLGAKPVAQALTEAALEDVERVYAKHDLNP